MKCYDCDYPYAYIDTNYKDQIYCPNCKHYTSIENYQAKKIFFENL